MDDSTLLLSSLVIAAIGYGLYYLFSIIKENKKYDSIPSIETERGILGFLFGHIRIIDKRTKQGVIMPEQHYLDMEKVKSKTIKYRMIHTVLVVTCDPVVVKAVFIDQNCFKDEKTLKAIGFPLGERGAGNGLVTEPNHEIWKHKRALLNPSFTRKALMSFIKEFNAKADILMQHLRTIAESKNNQVRLGETFSRTALDVIGSVAFSMNTDSVNDPNNMLNKSLFQAMDGVLKFFMDPLVKLKIHKWPAIWEYRKTLRFLRSLGRTEINKRLEMIKNGEPLPNDMLTEIFSAAGNQEFFVEDLIDEFITLFVAGQETTANALASSFLEIGRRPEILKKLRDEVDTVIGSKTEIDADDLSRLKYTGCVFKEALRLYPPASEVFRRTKEEIISEGIVIPRNAWIALSMYACGRTQEFYPDPLTFNPDRFMNEESNIKNYTYFPFSLGLRNCIGQNFAKIEAKIVIAKFIQNFNFELDMTQSFDLYQAVTIRPKDGARGTITLR